VAVPLLELFLLIRLGEVLGTLNTVLIVVLTGILGASFARSQGAGIISHIRTALNQGRIPGEEMVQGLLILAGGLMLITPGFLTDLLGFTLILPPTRRLAAGWLMAYFKKRMQAGQWRINDFRVDPDNHSERNDDNTPPRINQP
jgi:UPF0716 protein FxsA